MNDQELAVTRQRIQQFQDLLIRLRQCETAQNYTAMASSYLLEIDKMDEKVRGYLASPLMEQSAERRSSGSDVGVFTMFFYKKGYWRPSEGKKG